MAARNSVKSYLENGIYHLYNRGVEKRDIFVDDQDFSVFLSYLKTYLLPKDFDGLQLIISSPGSNYRQKQRAEKELALKNFSEEIDLLAYVLMPNHFHLLVKQTKADGIDRLMNAFGVRYTSYFNRKYKRVGPLFQGVYKAVSVDNEEQLLHLSRYIHRNPPTKNNLPSSLPDYLELKHTDWLRPDLILSYFNRNNPRSSYADFVGESYDLEPIATLALDID